MKNVFEVADTRQKQAKKRSLCVINEHFEPVFNTVAATQIVFQRPVKLKSPPPCVHIAMNATTLLSIPAYNHASPCVV